MKRRRNNEDAVLSRTAARLWAVADGMGGHQAGEVASQAITAALHEAGGSNGEADRGGDRLRAILPAIRVKLAAALDTAAVLTSDARAAELKDLAEQAHAVSQQLESLVRKLESAPGPAN